MEPKTVSLPSGLQAFVKASLQSHAVRSVTLDKDFIPILNKAQRQLCCALDLGAGGPGA